MNAENFDLNLIRVFLAVAKHRSVTEAGLNLGLTQSTVSHSLARLRALCNDQLFVRTSDGMAPTTAASAMIEPLEKALAVVRASMKGTSTFNPLTDDRCFNIVLSEIGQLIYLPQLIDHLTREAPHVTVKVLHLPIDQYRNALMSGDADLSIGHLPTLQNGFHQLKLFDDPYVCMLRADHPHIHASMSMRQYLAASHIVVEPPGRGPGLVEQALSRDRNKRRIVMRLPHFFAGPLILRRTNYLMTAPSRVKVALSDLNNIRFVPLPFKVELMHVKVLWHERMHHDAGHRWLRNTIAEQFHEELSHLVAA
ncbi:MAG: LysR family transcriptional regulator [Polaromonas sp.]|nr:LysR family transcriptional regulator [Polaromonas sp.]